MLHSFVTVLYALTWINMSLGYPDYHWNSRVRDRDRDRDRDIYLYYYYYYMADDEPSTYLVHGLTEEDRAIFRNIASELSGVGVKLMILNERISELSRRLEK